jgi:NAD(P)H-nitrite reductase large subunit
VVNRDPGRSSEGEPGAARPGERPLCKGSVRLPDEVEVCACAGAPAGLIGACADAGRGPGTTRATTRCGGCAGTVRELLAWKRVAPTQAAAARQCGLYESFRRGNDNETNAQRGGHSVGG